MNDNFRVKTEKYYEYYCCFCILVFGVCRRDANAMASLQRNSVTTKRLSIMLYRNKYRVETTRLSKWDYSSPGYYFITICMYDRGYLFGKIAEDLMALNEHREIAKDEWNKTGKQRLNLQLDEFIVMPNHLHGIVRLLDSIGSRQSNRFDYSNRSRDVARYVST